MPINPTFNTGFKDSVPYQLLLADLYIKNGDDNRARLSFEHALALHPNHCPTLFAYSTYLLERSADLGLAQELVDKILSIQEDHEQS